MSFCLCAGDSNEEDTSKFLEFSHDTEIPVKKRKQTDFPCFIVLILFCLLMVICVSVAASRGDIRRFINGYDDKGNICGFKNKRIEGVDGSGLDLTDDKFLEIREHCEFYDDINCPIEKACVRECPDGYQTSGIPLCAPKNDKNNIRNFNSFLEIVFSDLALCWREIVALCFFSILLSGLVLMIQRTYAKIFIWVIFLIVSVVSIGWTIVTWTMFGLTAPSKKSTVYEPSMEFDDNHMIPSSELEKGAEKKNWLNWMISASIMTPFTLVFFILLYRMRHKISMVAVLFEEGGRCIKNIPMMLLQPVLTHLITAVFACFLILGFVCLQTSGTAEIDEAGKVTFPNNIFFQIITWLLLFAFFWLSQFILACQNLVIAGTVSSWYFSGAKGMLHKPVWRSFNMVVKHHLGSAAFGSLLIAMLKAIRFIFRMFERRGGQNGLAIIIWAVVQCLLACLESILKILNKSAYVMIVLFGEPFCSSARRAFACITKDSSHIALLIGAGTFILAVTELLITFCVTVAGAAVFSSIDGIQSFWIPTSVVFVLAFLCCHCFFSVYEMTIDTLILCFCVDHQMNNGVEKPYYMNKNLMILLNENERVKVAFGNTDESNLQTMA